MKAERLETLIWVLIYGGLLVAGLGLFVSRQPDAEPGYLGGLMMAGGGIVAAVGVVLIYVRSRMRS